MSAAISRRITVHENLEPKELEAWMHKNGISKDECAEIFGVTPPAVHLWLTGERKISTTTTRIIRLFQKYPALLKEF